MSGGETESRIRAWAAARRLPQAYLERWLSLGESDRLSLLKTAEALRLRTGQLVTAFALLDEITVREDTTIAAIVARPEIRRILDGTGSAPGKAARFLDELHSIRYPRLREATGRLRVAISMLGLPHGISVILPRDLGSDEVRIEIVARGGAELENLIEAVSRNAAGLRRIAEMIGGAGEV